MLLQGKKLLITGVLMDSSIAFHVAKLAQEEGAEVVLTSFGRAMKITQSIAKRLPSTPPVIELDVTNQEHLDSLAERLTEHVDHLDGVLHSIGFAPPGCLQLPRGHVGRRRNRVACVGILPQSPCGGCTSADAPGWQRGRPDLRREVCLAGL